MTLKKKKAIKNYSIKKKIKTQEKQNISKFTQQCKAHMHTHSMIKQTKNNLAQNKRQTFLFTKMLNGN